MASTLAPATTSGTMAPAPVAAAGTMAPATAAVGTAGVCTFVDTVVGTEKEEGQDRLSVQVRDRCLAEAFKLPLPLVNRNTP